MHRGECRPTHAISRLVKSQPHRRRGKTRSAIDLVIPMHIILNTIPIVAVFNIIMVMTINIHLILMIANIKLLNTKTNISFAFS